MAKKEEAFNLSPEIEKLAEKLAKDPKSKLFLPLAEEYAKCGMFEEAMLTLKDGLKHNPGYIGARASLGKVYLKMGQLKEAEAEFNKVLQADQEHLVAIKKLAEINGALDKREEAVNYCKKALLLFPKDQEMTNLLASLEAKSAPAEGPVPVSAKEEPSPETLTVEEPLVSPPESVQEIEAEPEIKIEPVAEPVAIEPEEGQDSEGHKVIKKEVVIEGEERVPVYEIGEENEVDLKSILEIQDTRKPAEQEGGNMEASAVYEIKDEPPEEAITPIQETQKEEIKAKPEEPIDDFLNAPPDLDSFVAQPLLEETTKPAGEYTPPSPPGIKEETKETSGNIAEDLGVPPKEVQAEQQVEGEELSTMTLAELYIKQGLYDKGIEIYRALLEKNPGDEKIKQKLEDAVILSSLLIKKAEKKSSPVGQTGLPTPASPAPARSADGGEEQAGTAEGRKDKVVSIEREDVKKRLKVQRLQSWLDNIKRGH